MYLYLCNNHDWNFDNKYKYGFTINPDERIKNSHEQHSYLSTYKCIYKITKTDNYKLPYKEYDKIISLLSRNNNKIIILQKYYNYNFDNLSIISKYLVNDGGSIEFIYKDGISIFEKLLLNDFSILGLNVEKLNDEFIFLLNNNIIKSYNCKITPPPEDDNYYIFSKLFSIYNKRTYQEDIIKYSTNKLKELSKIYIELATGGGKSYIVYNIINNIKPKIIIIFSPRLNINIQNIKPEYLDILNEKYEIITDIIKPITKNTIISICTQSNNKIFDKIIKYNIKNIFIWFDEAHWGIENWCHQDKETYNFLLKDKEYINYRCFTSASPDKKNIKLNKEIFGKLYSHIKVKDLIKDKWLCNIVPHIFAINKKSPDIINYILSGFVNNNKKYGFSFHKDRYNAYNLFMKHYDLYINHKTSIKPFILVSDYNDLDNVDIIDNNFRDIKIFQKTENSIGYVVQQYNIGYDFKNIDIIFMSDPKMSHKDIIQSIGRGMRPDKNGINGKNLNKILHLYIPVFVEYEDANKYNKIKEVLKYLLYDIELSYDNDIIFDNIYKKNEANNKEGEKYDGIEEIKSKIFDLIKDDNKILWNLKKITKHLCKNNIHNQKDYNNYIKNNEILNMPENLFIEYKDFIWINTYKNNENPFYDKIECIKIIKKISNNDDKIEEYDDDEKIKYLNSIDNKIPNECLWTFYGGNRINYFIY